MTEWPRLMLSLLLMLCSHYTTEPCQNWAGFVYKANVNTIELCQLS